MPATSTLLFTASPSRQLLQGFWDLIGFDKEFRDIKVYKMESCAPSPYKLSLEVPLRYDTFHTLEKGILG